MIFKPRTKLQLAKPGPAYWFLFRKEELLVEFYRGSQGDQRSHEHIIHDNRIPLFQDIEVVYPEAYDVYYLGTMDGVDGYAASLPEKCLAAEGYAGEGDKTEEHVFSGLRNLYGTMEDNWYWLANRAYHLSIWRKKNRYCGSCGHQLHDSETETALTCSNCGNIIYPRISPAIIVAITKGEQILLAHAARFLQNMYSVIAGFVEAGETLEQCVAREVYEEVGIRVKNIRYFSSQPWPYPDSLMIAFTAEYESGEVRIDEHEITDAGWFSKDNLPQLPGRVSVARKLIEAWLSNM